MSAFLASRPLLVLMLAALATAATVVGLDRPAASFAHGAFHGSAVFVWLTHLVDPLLPLAVIGILGLGARLLAGRQPGPVERLLLRLCVATLLAVVVKDQLKFAFGRTWPETWIADNPSYIRDGVSGFSPFHGGRGWASFPSGHMSLVTAPVVVLMQAARPGWRRLLALPVLLVGIGLYGADYHFVGDILGGIVVGAVCAAIACRAVFAGGRPPPAAGSVPPRAA